MLRAVVGVLLLLWIVGLVFKLAVGIVWGLFLLAVAVAVFEWVRSRKAPA